MLMQEFQDSVIRTLSNGNQVEITQDYQLAFMLLKGCIQISEACENLKKAMFHAKQLNEKIVDKAFEYSRLSLAGEGLEFPLDIAEQNSVKFMAMLGLFGEAGETAKDVILSMLGKDANLLDEPGDVLYYLTALIQSNGDKLEDVAKFNIAKLKEKYPNGFKL